MHYPPRVRQKIGISKDWTRGHYSTKRGRAGAAIPRRASAESTRLSDREHQVLTLLADGLGAAQIAQQLYLSESTAKSHIARIYQKLGASNRAQALVTAMRIGLLSSLPSRIIAD